MPRLVASFSIPSPQNGIHTLGIDAHVADMKSDRLLARFREALQKDLDKMGAKAKIASQDVRRISSSMGMPLKTNIHGPAVQIKFNIQGLDTLDIQRFKNYQKFVAEITP